MPFLTVNSFIFTRQAKSESTVERLRSTAKPGTCCQRKCGAGALARDVGVQVLQSSFARPGRARAPVPTRAVAGFVPWALPSETNQRSSLQSQLFRQLLPLAVDQSFGLGVHQDFIRPGTREAFARPLSGSIDAHLRAVIRQAGSVVERIDRSERELYVALGSDVVEDLQGDIADVLHVDVFVHDDDALGEHRLAERPDCVHYFACLARIGLPDRDGYQV